MEEHAPALYRFERVCLLVHDKAALFRLVGDTTAAGELYTSIDRCVYNIVAETIKYPKNVGLTGRAIEEGRAVVSQLGKIDAEFSEEVDNAAGVHRIDNIIILPLMVGTEKQKELVGVLQMINCRDGDIKKENEEEIGMIADILAKCIDNVNSFSKSFNVMVGLHDRMGNALGILDEGERAVGFETKSVGKQLNDQFTQITMLVKELVDSKRGQFLKESNVIYSAAKPEEGTRRRATTINCLPKV